MAAFSLGKTKKKKEKVEINLDDYADYGDYMVAKRESEAKKVKKEE